MVFRHQHIINIYQIKSSGADIIQQSRRIAASKGIADILAAAKEAAAMEVILFSNKSSLYPITESNTLNGIT